MKKIAGRRGAALILVVIVIAALVAIAAPFAVSMRLHEKSARGFGERIKARRIAEAAANDAVAALITMNPDEKKRRGADPDSDTPEELWPSPRDLTGLEKLYCHNATAQMQDISTVDERGRIDINTVNAEVMSNLLGVTVTTDELSYEETNFLPVADVRPFYSDGDPNTLDGIVRVNGEFIGYHDVQEKPPGLKGLIRGMFFTRSPPPEDTGGVKMKTPAGVLVQDFRGWKIAWDSVWRWTGYEGYEGYLARFETPSAIRKIADWEFGTFAEALYSQSYGVTMDKLKEWGISKDKLDRAGLGSETDYYATPEGRKRLEEAEKGLSHAGADPSQIKAIKGPKGVVGAWEILKTLDSDQVANYVKNLQKRNENYNLLHEKYDGFWRGEVRRQIDELIALKEKTPELETIGRIELERIRPWITVDGTPEGEAWCDTQVVNHAVHYEPYEQWGKVLVQDARRFRAGSLLRFKRINPPGSTQTGPVLVKPEYRKVIYVHPNGPDHWAVGFFPQLDDDYEESTVEVSCQQPRPLNLNSARREVLVAALTGLQTPLFQVRSATGLTAPNFVTPDEAGKVADRIIAKRNAHELHSHQDLKAVLDDAKTAGDIDDGDEESILLNAIDPGNQLLTHGTVPFCYQSAGVFELTATGIKNDDAQNEIARVKLREVVETAPPRDLIWTLDSQQEMQDRLASNGIPGGGKGGAAPGGPIPANTVAMSTAYCRGKWSSLLDSFPVDVFSQPWQWPERTHGPQSTGKLQLSTVRGYDKPVEPAGAGAAPPAGGGGVVTKTVTPGTVIWSQHYTDPPYFEREGHKVPDTTNPVTVPATNLAVRGFTVEDGSIRLHVGPGTIRGWFRIDKHQSGSRTFIYDGGRGDRRERISLFYEDKWSGPSTGAADTAGATGSPALVAQVFDDALDDKESIALGLHTRPTAEFVAPIKALTPENWYHLALAWKGGERGDLAICLDGKPLMGKTTGGAVLGAEMTGTRLSSPIDGVTGTIPVDSTAGFPDHGWIRIGGYRRADGTLAGDLWTHNNPPYASSGAWDEFQTYGEVLYYSSKTATAFNCEIDPQRWIALYTARYPSATTIPAQTGGPDLSSARLPLRGTGRFQIIPDPSGANGFEIKLGVAHDTHTPVSIWGYTGWVKNGPNDQTYYTPPGYTSGAIFASKLPQYSETVRKGGATLTQALPENTPFTLVYKPHAVRDAAGNYPCILGNQTDITTVWAGAYPDKGTPSQKLKKQPSVGGFPPSGFLRIGNERVFYRGLDPTTGTFKNCTRGVDGTGDGKGGGQVHYLWEGVALESIAVTDPTDYPDRTQMLDTVGNAPGSDVACYVQLTPQLDPKTLSAAEDPLTESPVEWVSVLKVDPTFGNFFLMPVFWNEFVGARAGYTLVSPQNRFVQTPQKAGNPPGLPDLSTCDNSSPNWFCFPVYGDCRWFRALLNQWVIGGGAIPGANPGNVLLQVPQPPSPAPAKPPQPPKAPNVIVPPDAWQLKEFLKQMEPNLARAQKGTAKFSSLWTQRTPAAPIAGYLGTSSNGGRPHASGEKVIPTFTLGNPHVMAGNLDSGWPHTASYGKGDVVTITDDAGAPAGGGPDREERTITWWTPAWGGIAQMSLDGDPGTGAMVAFDDFVQRPYLGGQHARITKYPSGQLPGLNVFQMTMSVGAARPPSGPGDTVPDAPGSFEGFIDELVTTQEGEPSTAEDWIRAPQNVKLKDWPQPYHAPGSGPLGPADTNYETCRPPDGQFQQAVRAGILFRLDDEILASNNLGTGGPGQGLGVVRGVLGTAPDTHYSEAPLWWAFPFPKLAVCSNGFDVVKGNHFMMQQRPGGVVQPGLPPGDVINDSSFYVAIDRGAAQGGIVEVLPIKYRRQTQLNRPRDRYDRGCFRSAFGSGEAQGGPVPGDLLFDWPVRFHDRYTPAVSSIEGVFFQATKEVPGAYFESIEWDAVLPNDYTKVVIAVRVDGGPGWDADPAMKLVPGQRGRLYLFDDPKAANKILIKGDRVEVRAYLTFKPRAFTEDGWKQTPILKSVKLRYRQPTRVIRREEMQE